MPFQIAALVVTTLAIGGYDARDTAHDCSDSLARKINAQVAPALKQKAAAGSFSGVVLVTCDGTPLFSAAYGMANRATKTPITLGTRFNLGSMSKMWTAIAIAQFVEQGDQVLVRHLLTHTSGPGSYFTRGLLRDRVTLKRAADILPYFIDDSIAFPDGTRTGRTHLSSGLRGLRRIPLFLLRAWPSAIGPNEDHGIFFYGRLCPDCANGPIDGSLPQF